MASKLNPYITFDGSAREALEFYKDVFGGELAVNTFGDFGNDSGGDADKIMHGQLETDAGFTLMAADNPPGQDYTPGNNYSVSLSGDDNDQLRGYWEKLSDGGTVMVAAGEADVGRRVRHVRRQVRRHVDGQHRRERRSARRRATSPAAPVPTRRTRTSTAPRTWRSGSRTRRAPTEGRAEREDRSEARAPAVPRCASSCPASPRPTIDMPAPTMK